MMDLVHASHPMLSQRCPDIEEVRTTHQDLARLMIETMRGNQGVGLAAPQVGLQERLAVIQTTKMRFPLVLINPVITQTAGERNLKEGCLTLPGFWGHTTRSNRIWLDAIGVDGEEYKMTAMGLLAQAIEHEVDHLNGILYVFRMTCPGGKLHTVDDDHGHMIVEDSC